MKQDPTTKAWSIGPNLIPSYPSFEYNGHDITASVHPRIKGTTQRALVTLDVDNTPPVVDWFRLLTWHPAVEDIPAMELSAALEWRFIHLNRSYQQFSNVLSGTMDTVMVYSDVVQPNTVNGVNSISVDKDVASWNPCIGNGSLSWETPWRCWNCNWPHPVVL